MFIVLPGIVGHSSGGGGYPPYGTWLASVCSGNTGHDSGNTDYYDVNGNVFNGMFTLYQQFADGSGGSYWSNYGDNSTDGRDPSTSCWLPQYFYFSNGNEEVGFWWEACGSSGTFYYGQNSYYSYSNGDGTTSSGGGFNSYGYGSGYLIYDSGCCQVYFDGNSGYYYSDNCGGGGGGGGGCDSYGTYLGTGCYSSDGYDAAGNYWTGAWSYAEFYADGNCGSYPNVIGSNTMGCYLPSGYWISYSSTPSIGSWYIYDTCSNLVASGDYVYSVSSGGEQADGAGGSYAAGGTWQAEYGYQFASGSYSDCDSNYYNYQVLSDGSSGYYIYTYT